MFGMLGFGDLWAMEGLAMRELAAASAQLHIHAGKFPEPEVRQVNALNCYSTRELEWLGEDCSKGGGLVAVIPIKGSMTPGNSWRGADTEWVGRKIEMAVDDSEVNSIVLHFRTPGGSVMGLRSFAETIKAAAEKMPVLGFVEDICASAGLWAYSQCTECWMDRSNITGVGSLGVISSTYSIAEKLKKEGEDWRILRSKGAEDKSLGHPAEPISEAAVEELQMLTDKARAEFLAAVLSARPKVDKSITGRMFYGTEAIKAGLVDTRGDLMACIKRADYLARTKKT